MSEFIPVTRPTLPPKEEYFSEISNLWENCRLTNNGPKVQQLETELADFLNVPYITAVSSGTSGLKLALQALQLPQDSEDITTSFTFIATVHAIVRSRLVPVFCDVRASDGTLDPECLEDLISDKTGAILPVHVYGNLCDTEAIGSIAARRNLPVIYDAAHAFGVQINGTTPAALGTMTVYSFHATKSFFTAEGGAVCTRDAALTKFLRDGRNFGIGETGSVDFVGDNAKMSEFHAAMGLCNLRHFSEELAQRRYIASLYHQHLADVPGLRFFCIAGTCNPGVVLFSGTV